MRKSIKKAILLSSIVTVGSLSAQMATAKASRSDQTKHAALITSMAVLGAVVGGPAGLVVGGGLGAFLGQPIIKNSDALNKTEQELSQLESIVTEKEQRMKQLEQDLVEKIAFKVLFETGKDQTNNDDQSRILQLAHFLDTHPHLDVNLSGHSDHRGSDIYNNVLADERAKHVKQLLIQAGIDAKRIHTQSHGASLANTSSKDPETLAADRRVEIEVIPASENSQAEITANTLSTDDVSDDQFLLRDSDLISTEQITHPSKEGDLTTKETIIESHSVNELSDNLDVYDSAIDDLAIMNENIVPTVSMEYESEQQIH